MQPDITPSAAVPVPVPVPVPTRPDDPALARAIEQVRAASAAGTPLRIRGGGTKDFYGEAALGDLFDASALPAGHVHEPTELVVVAGAGMRVADLEALLAEHGQCLAFEPPHFGPGSTVGGMVAAGLSGPSRAAAGSVRDHVLGATLLDGRGELLSFGGQVIKNVAGYDVSRLLAGSLGVLGVIVDVSLKVLPIAAATATLRFEAGAADALARLHRWGAEPLPLNASAWCDGRLSVRLAGSRAAVASAAAALGGEVMEAAAAADFWRGVRDHRDAYFAAAHAAVAEGGATLWRLSVPQTAPVLDALGDATFIEWHGAERWLVSALPAARVREAATAVGGHATLFAGADKSAGVFTPLAAPLLRIHERLKEAFDPRAIFNRGRLYKSL